MVEVSAQLLGLQGFVVLSVAESAAGGVEVEVETSVRVAFCSSCGVRAAPHERSRTRVRHLPVAGRPCTLVWVKRRWRCRQDGCATVTWTEASRFIRPRVVLTEPARRWIGQRLATSPIPTQQVADEFGIAWQTAWAAFCNYAKPRVVDQQAQAPPPAALGVDETVFVRVRQRFGDRFCTAIVDLTTPRLLDVVSGRSSQVITDWAAGRGPSWTGQVQVAVCDPFRPYAKGLRTACPKATLVLDAFHLARLGLDALEEVRRATQRETLGRRARKGDPLYSITRLLRVGPAKLDAKGQARLQTALAAGDPDGHVRLAWQIAHRLCGICRHGHDAGQVRRRLHRIIADAAASGRPELRRLARTLTEWADPICARFDHQRISNAAAETFNGLVKKVKRLGHGYRNFTNYRLRILAYAGHIAHTDAITAERLRGHQPRSAA